MTATVHNLNRGAPPSLEPMMSLVADNMNAVNSVIMERMQSKIPLIPELAGHLIAGGGKRLRPMLTLACAELLEYQGERKSTRLNTSPSRDYRKTSIDGTKKINNTHEHNT